MTDPIQASSASPIPIYQTLKGAQDPLPVSSPKALDRSATARAEDDASDKADAFKDYLDRSGTTVVEKSKPKHQFDTADAIASASPYGQPGMTSPL